MNVLEVAITETFGARCTEHDEGCPCCMAWDELDRLTACRESLRKSLPKLINRLGENEDANTRQVVIDAFYALDTPSHG